jgi:invasion protein IalB
MRRMMKSSGMLFRSGILGAIVFFGLGSLAFAQLQKSEPLAPASKLEPSGTVDAEPNSTVANFGDWALHCQQIGRGAETQRVCEVAQQIRGQDQQNAVAELAIGRVKKSDPLRLTIVLPVNVTFSSPPSFTADGKVLETLELGWRKCLPGGCIADTLLNDDVLRRWKTQTSVERIAWTDAAGGALAIGSSFRGLAQALDALSKEP